MWYSVWKSCDKPRVGHGNLSYKLAKTKYRQACREALIYFICNQIPPQSEENNILRKRTEIKYKYNKCI